MFRNYLSAALRNLVRNKLYAAINIVGLAVGFSAALLVVLFVRDELSYDKWIPGYDRIYAVQTDMVTPSARIHPARAPYLTAGLLKQDFPQIQATTRAAPGAGSVRHGEIEFRETILWADPNFFEILDLPMVAGTLETALQEPDSVVLTRAMARKYFGRDNPLGETLELDRKTVMRVTAVLDDLPSNTHLDLQFIISGRNAASILTLFDSRPTPTGLMPNVFTYLRLEPGASVEALREALPTFAQRHPRYKSNDVSYALDLAPIADLHLRPLALGAMKPSGNAGVVYSALVIAMLIVAVASINFVNLNTARAMRRAVEVGIRKVSGAKRRNLIAQFIGESVIYALLSMVLAVAFTQFLLPPFNAFLGRTIIFDYVRDPRLAGAIIAAVASIGVLAGAYPALILSRFSPAGVLKGGVTRRMRGGRGRQALVAFQFTILIVLALVSTMIYRQAHYAMNEALRFDKDQMLVVVTAAGVLASGSCETPFVAGVRALPGVRAAACASNSVLGGDFMTKVAGPDGTSSTSSEMIVDFNFFDVYGVKPLAGRLFSPNFGGDVRAQDGNLAAPPSVVINESLSRALGFATPQNAVGQIVRWRPFLPLTAAFSAPGAAPKPPGPEAPSQIVGVVQDLVAPGSKLQPILAEIFWVNPVGNNRLNIRLEGSRIPETLAAIDRLWEQTGPPQPINRNFLDQQIQDIYRDVTQLNKTMTAFAGVAVFISCLGLFGLAAFAAEQRTKEIGVRKALGASKADIVRLMLWEFSQPVLWGSLAAWPLAYFIMHRWLEGFADRVDIGLWTFPVASALALGIAAMTVAGHALLVARAEPVSALRYE